MSFDDPISDYAHNKLSGRYYPGTVVDNNDPLKLQRVRVRVVELHRDVDDTSLPWALPFSKSVQGNSATIGAINVPVIGSQLWVHFPDEHSLYNIYYLGSLTTADVKLNELVNDDYPHVYGYIDRTGNLFAVNTTKNWIKFVHVSGTMIWIDGAGQVNMQIANNVVGGGQSVHPRGLTLQAQNGLQVDTVGEAKLTSTQHMKISSDDVIDIDGSTVYVNTHGYAATDPAAPTARTRPASTPFTDKTEF